MTNPESELYQVNQAHPDGIASSQDMGPSLNPDIRDTKTHAHILEVLTRAAVESREKNPNSMDLGKSAGLHTATGAGIKLSKYPFDTQGSPLGDVEISIEAEPGFWKAVKSIRQKSVPLDLESVRLVESYARQKELKREEYRAHPYRAGSAKSVEKRELFSSPEIRVSGAKNPYHEALKEGGIADATLNPETEDRTIDLQKILDESIALFQSSKLSDWENDIQKADINRLAPDKRALVEALVRQGWDVIAIMPGRDAQLKQLKDALIALKPLWIKDSAIQPYTNNSYIWNYIGKLIHEKSKELTAEIPERPYILLTQPTQAPRSETTNMTVKQQQAWLADEQKTNPDFSAIAIGEYAVLQALFTSRIKKEAAHRAPSQILKTLDPLDRGTFTRFINLPVSPGGVVPGGYWDPDNRQMKFGRSDADNQNPGYGFRLSVRVEL